MKGLCSFKNCWLFVSPENPKVLASFLPSAAARGTQFRVKTTYPRTQRYNIRNDKFDRVQNEWIEREKKTR